MSPLDRPWPAPRATAPLAARVTLPGSKSLTNRYLVLAALAEGPSVLRGALRSRDTDLMVGALRALGAGVHLEGTRVEVAPGPLRGQARVDVGLAGTVMRFVPALAALADGPVAFDGDAAARTRPMAPLLGALRDLGVDVQAADGDTLPFEVRGTGGVAGGTVEMDASASSQFVSALLLVAGRFGAGLDLRHRGGALPSAPHVAMTAAAVQAFGGHVQCAPDRWSVAPWRGPGRVVDVEPDLSGAAPFLAAALVAGGSVSVPGWPEVTTQAGDMLREILTSMGARVTWAGGELTVRGEGAVGGVDVDLHRAGELTPVVAALAALAEGPSRLRGVGHLRGHETDRLAALATEIRRMGGRVREEADGLDVEPAPLHGAVLDTYHDHRMAMFAAVVGLRVPGVEILDVATTAKTLPGFTDMWTAMLADRRRAPEDAADPSEDATGPSGDGPGPDGAGTDPTDDAPDPTGTGADLRGEGRSGA